MAQNRNHRPAKEKVKIIRLHLLEGVPVSDLCQQFSIIPSQYYAWQRKFFENGEAAFARKPKGGSPETKKLKVLEDKLGRKNEVLSEVMEEFVQLKKELGGV